MEEKYWNRFIASGSVRDYLNYRGIAICAQVMRNYRHDPDSGKRTGAEVCEPDYGNGNGIVGSANGGI